MSVQVMVVDDSVLARNVLTNALEADPGIEVIGTAGSVEVAWQRILRLRPQVITLDLCLGSDDGLTLLRRVMADSPTATVVVSSVGQRGSRQSVAALTAGAVFVVAKPDGSDARAVASMESDLREKVKEAASTRVRRISMGFGDDSDLASDSGMATNALAPAEPRSAMTHGPELIAIGTSTGGAAALAQILPLFPPDSPPVVIVDHMPEGYTNALARQLDAECRVSVREAVNDEPLKRGHVLIAPGGDRHLHVTRVGGALYSALTAAPATDGHRPSVTELFMSVASSVGNRAAAALLTGMGRDGATGLLAVRRAGGLTITQDEGSSVVYGMPKAGGAIGASMVELALDRIPLRLLQGR